MNRLSALLIALACISGVFISGCNLFEESPDAAVSATDQLGRKVKIPRKLDRIAALHHFGGKIVYALGQQHRLVEKSIYGREAKALNRVDADFAALPDLLQGHSYNIEGMVKLGPQLVFLYASTDMSEMAMFENAGIPVFAVKGETFEESFEAVGLMSGVLDCPEKGREYIGACRDLLDLVKTRLSGKTAPDVRVLFAGPKSIYSAATGNMLQSRILERAGAVNVASELRGFWADISPEQVALWNPEVIFLGSSLDTYGREKIFKNPHFRTVTAIKNRAVWAFPSNIGWWDYPAPHCVLGVVWAAKKLYPDRFEDVDMTAIANRFYKRFVGYTFKELGGRLQ